MATPDNSLKNNSDNEKYFWLYAIAICVLMIFVNGQNISKSFTGLHSLGQAHFAWVAKAHIKYGLGYTHGFDTFAVGNPPAKNPIRYLDHPQLTTLCNAAAMKLFGINVSAIRIANLFMTVIGLSILMKIVRALYDIPTAILTGLFFCLFPLIGYFADYNMWLIPVSYWSFWCYLVITGRIDNGPKASRLHYIGLGACLFIGIQLGWEGFFWALTLGVHYVSTCLYRRQKPQWKLLLTLAVAPALSLILVFAVIFAGKGFDIKRIIELYKWRAGGGEMGEFEWDKWYARVWEFALLNFTAFVLLICGLYFTVGQSILLGIKKTKTVLSGTSRRFKHFWLFLLPGIFQLYLLKGTLWMHHYWEMPFVPILAISTALMVMLAYDLISRKNRKLAVVVSVAVVICAAGFCLKGLNHYNYIKHWSPEKVKLFMMLNGLIPENQSLLSYEDFIFNQSEAKQAGYRPEVAWYLDRDVVVARSLEEIQRKAATGKFRYYLVPLAGELSGLINQLAQKFSYKSIAGDDGAPQQAGMYPYALFDLHTQKK
jgi:hypothetical protein